MWIRIVAQTLAVEIQEFVKEKTKTETEMKNLLLLPMMEEEGVVDRKAILAAMTSIAARTIVAENQSRAKAIEECKGSKECRMERQKKWS